LQQWYNIADDTTEYVINDRLSFQRFLGFTLNEKVPDAKTIWAFKERLKNSGVDQKLFALFTSLMEEVGVITREGSIIDASFIEVPRQRNSRKDNATIKSGETPAEWLTDENKNMLAQKDVDARWTKKDAEVHYGYKDHIKIDKDSKMIVSTIVTPAAEHDSQCFYELIDESDRKVWADSAYEGVEIHEIIREDFPGVELLVIEKSRKGKPLTEVQRGNNREKSKIRVRIEHIFGHMTQSMGGKYIRCIGIYRAIRDILMNNLAYNLQRFTYLSSIPKKSMS